jgi:type III restriction enzyme
MHEFTLAGAAAEGSWSILHKAAREFPALRFDRLKERWPALRSMREFLSGPDWCGSIRARVESGREERGAEETLEACRAALAPVADYAAKLRETWEGSREFTDRPVREVFTDKTRLLAEIKNEGEGTSQNDPSLPPALRYDLSDKDWYAYDDNFGTTEEKAFVKYFAERILPSYEPLYDDIRLVRNERQMPLFTFDGGERFEPDFVLFLRKKKSDRWETRQIFVEPKGTHLLETDAWKETFLEHIERNAVAAPRWSEWKDTILVGLPFFNRDERSATFRTAALRAGGAAPEESSFSAVGNMAAER